MDLSKYDTTKFAADGADMHVVGPDDTPLLDDVGSPVTIRLLGADSAAYQDATHRVAKGNREFKFSGGNLKIDQAKALANMIDVLAACTVSWSGIDYKGQSPYPCTAENARTLYRDLPWLREQAQAFVHDRQQFLGGSSPTS